ncbi:Guanidinobutyrase [Phlyctema vagabunda]|uniref:Guanidinobutyrase n=1 Tax=Phlyctema vagabunda TaxID=108571 RepID=A0ABR4PCG9_9HELO
MHIPNFSNGVASTLVCLVALSLASTATSALPDQEQQRVLEDSEPSLNTKEQLERKWGFNWGFSGISTFGHLEHFKCLTEPDKKFDIGIIGAPFDTASSFRSGSRFGPRSIRAASARHAVSRAYNPFFGLNPYSNWAKVIDCGDIPVTPFDNALAMQQMTEAFTELGLREGTAPGSMPKLIILGGDHLVALPALRALKTVHNEPVALLHFDSHLDTLRPSVYPQAWPSKQADFNHGTVFWNAYTEGLLRNDSVHAGINTRLSGADLGDYDSDDEMGFLRISAAAVDDIGTKGVIDLINNKIEPHVKVYLSIDIDVLDPAFAPGTGAPEPGGWTTRELLKILRGCSHLNIVGADIVEVAPAYDSAGSDTAFVAAGLAYEIISGMVKNGLESVVQNTDPHVKKQAKTEL